MKKVYAKPVLFYGREPSGLVPVVAGIAAALGVSQAVAGLGLGAAAGLAAVGGGVAAGKALSNKHHFDAWYRLPTLDAVMA
jgi:hypothetical protein